MSATPGRLLRMVDFNEAVKDRTGGQSKVQKRDYLPEGQIPVIDQGQSLIAGYTDDDHAVFTGDLPVVLFGDHTLAFKYVDFSFALGADGVKALSINEAFHPKYLFYYWQSCHIESRGYSRHFKYLKDVSLPLIPLSEQRRIVEILDQADALRKKRVQADAKAARILPALFYKMFGDPVMNPKRWPLITLGQLLSSIEGGWSPRCLDRPAREKEWGVLKLGSVTWCRYNASENKALPHNVEPRADIEVKKGDVLFSRKNTHQLVAACAFISETRTKLMMSDLIFRLNIRDRNEILPEFLSFLLGQTSKRAAIQRLAAGAAGSMPNISRARLRSAEIPVPPIQMQRKFSEVFNQFSRTDAGRQKSGDLTGILFKSILHSAFTGDLTANYRKTCTKELMAEMEAQAMYWG